MSTHLLHFTPTHEWLSLEKEDAVVGITEHAQALLGDMVFVDLPKVGDHVEAGDEIGVLESVKAASDFYAPISGTIKAINQQVSENPALINSDPYGEGWLIKISPKKITEIQSLLNETQYQHRIAEEH